MGRSQVLYNQTKGRNRNQAGRGGSQDNDTSGTGRTNDNRTKNSSNSSDRKPHNLPRQPLPRGSIDNSHQKDYEHEYELLFAGRDTYLSSQSSSSSKNKSKNNFDDYDEEKNVENSTSFFVGGTGSICILSMAATLESMPVARRLRIPLRVAATAFPSRFRTEQAREEENEEQDGHHQLLGTQEKKEKEEDLEDWLDDACGIDENTQDPGGIKGALKTTEMPSSVVSNPSSPKHGDSNNTTDNLLAKAEEEYDDDNLDDWLDSVIE